MAQATPTHASGFQLFIVAKTCQENRLAICVVLAGDDPQVYGIYRSPFDK